MNKFYNKSILFFAPKFFGYDIEIKKKLISLGAFVDLYDERPSSSFHVKAIIRINKKLLTHSINNYFQKIIRKNKNKKYDYVFIIKGEVISPLIIQSLKVSFPSAKFILYLWDSIENYNDINKSLFLFDRTMTFDLNDSLITPNLIFRPLFFIDDYFSLSSRPISNQPFKYDMLFIGTVHSDRWKFLEKLKAIANQNKLKVYYFLYIQSLILLIFRKLFDKNLKSIPLRDLKLHSISKGQVISLIGESRILIDIPHPKQTGLTIRTIETLGAKRKLITTNSMVRQYDFYDPNNIYVVDRYNPKIDKDFLRNVYSEIDEKIYFKYSISGWLDEVFCI